MIFVFTYLFVYLYLILNGMNYASLFSLYFISFGVFVGGRFIYVFFNDLFMGGWANLSILFDLDYMTISNFNYNENLDTFNLVISWLFFPAIGYLFTLDGKSKDVLSIEFSPSEVKRALKMAILFFLIQLPEQIYAIITVSSKGYYALYSDFSYSKIYQYARYLFLISGSIALIEPKTRKWIFFLLIINGVLSGITGARGMLITTLLSIIFIIGLFHKVSLKRLLIFLIGLYFSIFLLTFLSPRYENSATLSDFARDIVDFFYARGGIIGVIGYSIHSVGDITLALKLGWFIPGLERLVSYLGGEEITNQTESFSRLVSYTANPEAFYNGQGLGSSIISESYLVTDDFMLAALLSLAVGFTLGFYEKNMRKSKIMFMVVIAISPNIFFSVRDSLDSIYLLAAKYYILSWIVYFLIRKISFNSLRGSINK